MKKCEYFPCHKGIKEEAFRCEFCYCPLYNFECGGFYKKTKKGIKDCSGCFWPHIPEGMKKIIEKLNSGIV